MSNIKQVERFTAGDVELLERDASKKIPLYTYFSKQSKVMLAFVNGFGPLTKTNVMEYVRKMKVLIGKHFDDESPNVQNLLRQYYPD